MIPSLTASFKSEIVVLAYNFLLLSSKPFSLKLSSIGYERLMIFLLCYAFNCALRILVIQLTIHQLIDHSIDHATIDHSIDQLRLNHSIGFCPMLVTTRSQAKLLGISTEFSKNMPMSSLRPVQIRLSHSTSTLEHLDSIFTLRSGEFF